MENTAMQSSLGTQQIIESSVVADSTVGTLHIDPSHGGGHTHAGVAPPPSTNRTGLMIGLVIVAILLAAAVVEGIRSRSKDRSELNDSTQAAAVQTVFVTRPSGGSVAQEITLPGNTQAFTDTPIYARTSGYLRRWYADIGAHVRKGQLLADIETPELDQQLQQAQADLLSSKANMDLAQTTSVRWQGLLEKHAVSKQETDQVVSDYAAKQAAYASSEANVRRLQQLQSYERVLAPFDGIITARSTDIGALIGSGSGAAPKELFHEAAMGRLLIYVAVPEVYANAIRDGQKVTITQDANPGDVIEGTISRNSNAINDTSRTLNVQVGVDNSSGRLKPGAYVFVHLKLPSVGSHTFTIPSNTLLFRAEGLRVGVVRDGVATLVPITIGHDFGATVEVTSGLGPDDQIVLDPSDSLISGTKVQAKPAKEKAL